MALIKCTECGKSFSDKAACCPECGCPTDVVMKESKSPQAIARQQQTSEQASATMLAEVEKAKSRGRSADRLFDSRNRDIQRKASQSIDLFGGHATSRVVEIRSDARRACDDLYTSYQTLVASLDAVCRPLLASNPSGQAIKAVSDAISYFNSESEIESNFTASFNGQDLGDVANSKYVPSISNKMIQRFWEEQYSATPYAKDAANRRRKEAEEARARREAERKRMEEAKKEEEKRKAEEKEKAHLHWKQVTADVRQKENEHTRRVREEAKAQLQSVQKQVEEKIAALKKEKQDCENRLSGLGVFRSGEKKSLQQQIRRLDFFLEKLSDPGVLANEQRKINLIADDAIQAYSNDVAEYLSDRFPYSKSSKSPKRVDSDHNEFSEDASAARKAIPAAPDAKAPFAQHRK